VIGGVLILLGLCVIPTVIKRSCCCTCGYGCILTLFFGVMVTLSIGMLSLNLVRPSHIEQFCNKDFTFVPTRIGLEGAAKLYD